MSRLPTLRHDTLILRPWSPGDAPDLHREIQDPEVVRWLNIGLPYTLEDAEAFVGKAAEQWADREAAHFVIADSPSGRFLGYLGVLSVVSPMRVVELVYWVAAAARGGGVATRAVEAVMPWVNEVIAPERIELAMAEGNTASAAVAEANGFELSVIIIGGAVLDGEPTNERIYERNCDNSTADQ